MAFVGMRHVVFAPIKTEIEGQAVQYDKGVVVGAAIGATININRNSEDLYGDDRLIESDNSMTGANIDLTVDDMSDEVAVAMLGYKKDETGNVYHEEDAATPYGGLGYIRVRLKNGKTGYQANWMHKVQLSVATESSSTKGQNVSWQTVTVTGKMMGVKNNAEQKTRFRERQTFEDEAEAIAWLDGKAGITAAAAAASEGEFADE